MGGLPCFLNFSNATTVHLKKKWRVCGNHFCYCTTSPLLTKIQKRETQLWKIHKQSCTLFQKLMCVQNLHSSQQSFYFFRGSHPILGRSLPILQCSSIKVHSEKHSEGWCHFLGCVPYTEIVGKFQYWQFQQSLWLVFEWMHSKATVPLRFELPVIISISLFQSISLRIMLYHHDRIEYSCYIFSTQHQQVCKNEVFLKARWAVVCSLGPQPAVYLHTIYVTMMAIRIINNQVWKNGWEKRAQ